MFASGKFRLEIIDEFGQKKGKRTVLFTAVRSLECGGIYNENLDKLYKKGFLKNSSAPKYFSAPRHDLHEKLGGFKQGKTLCAFFFGTEFSTGIVVEIAPEEFSIANIAYPGAAKARGIILCTLRGMPFMHVAPRKKWYIHSCIDHSSPSC